MIVPFELLVPAVRKVVSQCDGDRWVVTPYFVQAWECVATAISSIVTREPESDARLPESKPITICGLPVSFVECEGYEARASLMRGEVLVAEIETLVPVFGVTA